MNYLDKKHEDLQQILYLIDKKISKGKGIKSLRKAILKRIKHLDKVIEQI